MELIAGGMLIKQLANPSTQKIEDILSATELQIWNNRISTTIQTDSANATIYGDDPSNGATGLSIAGNSTLTLAYRGPLWVTAAGTVTLVILY